VVAEPDAEDSLLDKVMPDDGYDKLVAQSYENVTEDSVGANSQRDVQQQNSIQNNKDRLQVISGGRDTKNANSVRVTKMPITPAASTVPEATSPVTDAPGDSD